MASKQYIEKTLAEVIALEKELFSLLGENTIGFVLKYDLSKLLDKVKKLTKAFRDQESEIFKKFGEKREESNDLSIAESEEGKEELKKLYQKKEKFTEKFNRKDFESLVSKFPYHQIMEFIK